LQKNHEVGKRGKGTKGSRKALQDIAQ